MTKFKVTLTFVQQVRGISFAYNVQWPQAFRELSSLLKYLALDLPAILPFRCVADMDRLDQFLTVLLVTIMLNVVCMILWQVGRRSGLSLLERAPKFALLYDYILYISIANMFFSILPCLELDDGKSYLRIDLSVSCDTSRYQLHRVLAILGILLFVVGYPLLCGLVLYPHRALLSDAS